MLSAQNSVAASMPPAIMSREPRQTSSATTTTENNESHSNASTRGATNVAAKEGDEELDQHRLSMHIGADGRMLDLLGFPASGLLHGPGNRYTKKRPAEPPIDIRLNRNLELDAMLQYGKEDAEAALLGAGYLGGNGRVMVFIWALLGFICVERSAEAYDMFRTGDYQHKYEGGMTEEDYRRCRTTRFVMTVIYAFQWTSLAPIFLLRAYFLHSMRARKAFNVTVWAFGIEAFVLLAMGIAVSLYMRHLSTPQAG